MIKQSIPKLWQILYKILPFKKFWRGMGNPYTRKLIWYCDVCKERIDGIKWEKCNAQYCEPCYKQMTN